MNEGIKLCVFNFKWCSNCHKTGVYASVKCELNTADNIQICFQVDDHLSREQGTLLEIIKRLEGGILQVKLF